jgi:hypothetical protein
LSHSPSKSAGSSAIASAGVLQSYRNQSSTMGKFLAFFCWKYENHDPKCFFLDGFPKKKKKIGEQLILL